VSGRTLPPTAGALTALARGPRGLRIAGWVCSLAGGELEGFEVFLGTQKQSAIEWRAHPARRAPRDGRPVSRRPSRSNFRIVVRAMGRPDAGALVAVIPRFAGQNTRPLFGALDLRAPLPPKRDRAAVAVDFLPKAFRSLSLLVGLGRLRRDGSILDIGCGVGRITYALAQYLSARGRYEGLDAVPRWVEWNRKTISARFPNFRFRLAGVRNGLYSRRGRSNAERLQFSYDDDTFDTAFVESVFQHNRVPAVRHYLNEIGRVLRSGGRCVVTSFLLRRDSVAADQRADGLDFLHPLEGAWSASAKIPEIGIAFEAARFEQWVGEAGLEVAEFHRGEWHGEGPGIAYQDVIVLEKPRRLRRRGGSRRHR
jgi:ubiquinone/menaquinone biosynthesis C-methylase UbiE